MYPGIIAERVSDWRCGSKPDFTNRYNKYLARHFVKNPRAVGATKKSRENAVEYSTVIFEVVFNVAAVVCL